MVSNFHDYPDIAAAYEREAAPRAQPTQRIANLARDIVGDVATPRDKAARLYAWVQKEISFAGNCLGGGDVVPRTTDLVLDMKRGDCMDHATLLQAMLDSVGVVSSQALIYTRDRYEVPELPCWQAFNHVINHLPDFDLFLDATATRTPFGELPAQARGKPVLLTRAAARLLQIPTASAAHDWSRVRNTVNVSADGAVEIDAHFEFGGALAHSMRHELADMTKSPNFNRGERQFRQYFESDGYRGSGYYARVDDTAVTTDRFSFDTKYRIDGFLDTEYPYGVRLEAYFPSLMPISALAAFAAVEDYPHEFLCSGDRRTEQLRMRFPDTVTLLAVPRGVKVVAGDVSYSARP